MFVMYNYARLATLFASFDQAVANGTYPPLPPVDSLDFGCLREEVGQDKCLNCMIKILNLVNLFHDICHKSD